MYVGMPEQPMVTIFSWLMVMASSYTYIDSSQPWMAYLTITRYKTAKLVH
jgi:hypothetical protein